MAALAASSAASELAVANAARIASLEEEVLLAKDRARSADDEVERLRRQLRTKEIALRERAAAERLSQTELAKATGQVRDMEEVVSALREELKAKDLNVQAEREARTHIGETAAEWQRQVGESAARVASAVAAEQNAKESAAAAEATRALALADAERAQREAAAAREDKAAAVAEAAASGQKACDDLRAQLSAAHELAQAHVTELVTLRESSRALHAELDARTERLEAMSKLLETAQSAKVEVAGELTSANHERWESVLQARLRAEQAEALEARVGFLTDELAAKDARLRSSDEEADGLRTTLRRQQASLSQAETALQRARVIELPKLREVRHARFVKPIFAPCASFAPPARAARPRPPTCPPPMVCPARQWGWWRVPLTLRWRVPLTLRWRVPLTLRWRRTCGARSRSRPPPRRS